MHIEKKRDFSPNFSGFSLHTHVGKKCTQADVGKKVEAEVKFVGNN
jgi:hypothetical protein